MARLYLILCQRQTLPLGQRMNHLSTGFAQILDRERHSALHTVQVVVDTQSLQHEERCRHTTQTQFRRQVLLEEFLNQFNTLFRLSRVEQTLIVYGFN